MKSLRLLVLGLRAPKLSGNGSRNIKLNYGMILASSIYVSLRYGHRCLHYGQGRERLMLSNKQKALIHFAKSKLCLADADYREILEQETGRKTAADVRLVDGDFVKLMARFKALGFEGNFRGHDPELKGEFGSCPQNSHVPRAAGDRASAGQVRKLAALAAGRKMSAAGLSSFLKRMGLPEQAAWLSSAQAGRAIEGMKKMIGREEKQESGDRS